MLFAYLLCHASIKWLILMLFIEGLFLCWKLVESLFCLFKAFIRSFLVQDACVKMESVTPASPQPAIIFWDDLQTGQGNYPLDCSCSAESLVAINSYGANFLAQSQKKGSGNGRTEFAGVSASSCQWNCAIVNNSEGVSCDGSSDVIHEISKTEKPNKRSSRKKVTKTGEQHKEPSSFCNDSIDTRASVLEICSSNGPAFRDKNGMAFDISLQEAVLGKNNQFISDVDSSVLKPTASFSDKAYESETVACLPLDFGEYCGCDQVDVERIQNQNVDVYPSNIVSEMVDRHLKQNSNDGSSSGVFSDGYDDTSLDSSLDGWNSDGSPHDSDDAKIQALVEEGIRISDSESRSVSECNNYSPSSYCVTVGKGHFSHGMSCNSNNELSNCQKSKLVGDTGHNMAETKCFSQGTCSNNSQSIISGNKCRKARNLATSSSGMWRLGDVKMCGPTRKKNNHLVWQKVQKNDIDGCINEPKTKNPIWSQCNASKEAILCLEHDSFRGLRKNDQEKFTRSTSSNRISARTEEVERVSGVNDLYVFSFESEEGVLQNKDFEKLKRKPGSGSKQEQCNFSGKGLHTDKTTPIRRLAKINMQEKEALKSVKYEKGSGASSKSPCYTMCQRVPLTYGIDHCLSIPLQNSQAHLDKKPNLCHMISDMHVQATRNPMNLMSRVSDCLVHKHALEEQSYNTSKFQKDLLGQPCFSTGYTENGPVKLDAEVAHAKSIMQDHDSASVMQKWIPIGKKDAFVLGQSKSLNLATSCVDEPVNYRWYRKGIEQKQSGPDSYFPISLARDRLTSGGHDFGILKCSSPTFEGQTDMLRYQTPPMHEEHGSMQASSDFCLTQKKDQSIAMQDTDSNMISQAVNDAYKLQMKSDGFHLATCNPLAEFEKLLHSASPVLGQICSVQDCQTCLRDHLVGNSLCRHQIPNIALGSLWHWYEEPGNCGLEVKVEDYQNSKRLGIECFKFRAYFVPSLSAVQLFGRCRCSICTSKCEAGVDVNSLKDSSDLGHLPILSMLLPRPCRQEGRSSSLPVSSLCNSYQSAPSDRDYLCNQSVTGACNGDPELLFEYFESEQPQQRRPLFEKIQELLKGDATPNYQVFGDPLKLERIHLLDLHPSSWYSVAWYPIYRIPDGNFRAAFLTYHSLGHFVQRNTSPDSLHEDACIASPVVGLQSYNAQNECWFQPRTLTAAQAEENVCLNPAEILKERLRTLEQTASVMARASVRKGDQNSINRHPDYEFFLSRRR